jgi:hypothetical protein
MALYYVFDFFFFLNFGLFIRKIKKCVIGYNWWNIKWNTQDRVDNFYSAFKIFQATSF